MYILPVATGYMYSFLSFSFFRVSKVEEGEKEMLVDLFWS